MGLATCETCNATVSENAKVCPRCGEIFEQKKIKFGAGFVLTVLGIVMLLFAGILGQNENKESPANKWFVGGTLHDASGLEWQTASSENKLATCADFAARLWKRDGFKASIAENLESVEDLRPYAEELVSYLDSAFAPDPDPVENRKLFEYQMVSETAAVGAILMNWSETK